MEWLHFLNLQYLYCSAYSLFGGRCAFLETLSIQPKTPPTSGAFEKLFEQFATLLGSSSALLDALSSVLSFVWGVYSAVAFGVSGFLFFSILTTLALLLFLRTRELHTYGTLPPKVEGEQALRHAWQELLEGALSADPTRWKSSILSADKMLGDLLSTLGVAGATTPDKMRALPEEAFLTVPQAWEAHRVRNFISNGHSDFILTQREAYRVMKLYEQVFEEFNFI